MLPGGKSNLSLLLLSLLLLISPVAGVSQNAPVTAAATVAGAQPGPVTVPVTVTDFSNIGAISLTLEFDNTVASFASVAKNPLLAGTFNFTDNDLGNGKHRIMLSWFGNGVTLTDGSDIFTVTFNYIAGITTLEWIDNGGSCQYADGLSVILNDTPADIFYLNGYICGAIAVPETVAGSSAVCAGQTGVAYSVAPVVNATGYFWAVPSGASIVAGSGTNSVVVDYSAAAVSGNISVNGVNSCGDGPSSQLPVTVNALPVANAGNDTTISYGVWTTLHAASGGSGAYAYEWSPETLLVNPNLQNPQTVQLTATNVFTMVIANQATLCSDSDEVIVTVAGGPLNTGPYALPDWICQGDVVQLFSNAGGGSGDYTYQWSSNPAGTPPWSSTLANPQVACEISTQYLVIVSDGYNSASGSTFVTATPVPATPVISISGIELQSDQCCGNQWYLDGAPLPGDTAQTCTPAESGSYFDVITLNGCSSDTSNRMDIIMTNVDKKNKRFIKLYPNPAKEMVKLTCSHRGFRAGRIQIINSFGSMVKEVSPEEMVPGAEWQFYAGDMASGFYLVKIQEENETFVIKLVVE
jgi:hypothetical protein